MMKSAVRVLEMKKFWQNTCCKCPVNGEWLNRNRIISLDVGSRNVGVAISDDYQMTALPFTTLTRLVSHGPLSKISIEQLNQLIGENEVKGIVIGVPSNDISLQQEFLDILINYHNITISNIMYWDESYSSIIANDLHKHQLGIAFQIKHFGKRTKIKRPKRLENIDSLAAQVILEEYLSAANRLFFKY